MAEVFYPVFEGWLPYSYYQDYMNVHDANNASEVWYGSSMLIGQAVIQIEGNWRLYVISRGIAEWEVVFPTGMVVGSAHFRICLENKTDMEDNDKLVAVRGDFADTPTKYDYHSLLNEVTSYAELPVTEMVNGAYYDLEITGAGLSSIKNGGLTKFAFRSYKDIMAQAPLGFITKDESMDLSQGIELHVDFVPPSSESFVQII
ncbi:MAG: hypothetical protein WC455_21615 [Dehalococcoidia bacterium]|jgi:hypothetical protein